MQKIRKGDNVIVIAGRDKGRRGSVLRRVGVPAFARGVLCGGGAVAGAVVLNFLVLLLGTKGDWQVSSARAGPANAPLVRTATARSAAVSWSRLLRLEIPPRPLRRAVILPDFPALFLG